MGFAPINRSNTFSTPLSINPRRSFICIICTIPPTSKILSQISQFSTLRTLHLIINHFMSLNLTSMQRLHAILMPRIISTLSKRSLILTILHTRSPILTQKMSIHTSQTNPHSTINLTMRYFNHTSPLALSINPFFLPLKLTSTVSNTSLIIF